MALIKENGGSMTLKKKILLGYGVSFALMGLVVGWGVVNLVALGKASDAILHENYQSILAAENMLNSLERQDSAILITFLGETGMGIAKFRENDASFLQWLARAKGNITIKGEARLIQIIDTHYESYRKLYSKITELREIETSSTPEALTVYRESVYPLFIQIHDACAKLLNLNEETMYAASFKAEQVADRAIWSTVVVALSSLIIALSFSICISERIVRPLKNFIDASKEISSGNYKVQVVVDTTDELGALAGEFNQMASKLEYYHAMNIEQIVSQKNKGEAILSSIADALVVFDNTLRVTEINSAARKILSLECSDVTALQCEDIFTARYEDIPTAQSGDPVVLCSSLTPCEMIRKTVETGKQPDIPDEERVISLGKGDKTRHYLYSITVIPGGDSVSGRDRHLSGILMLLKDITHFKELERLKSEFVMAASHELRTPLTSMGMSIDLLMEHAVDSLAKKDQELLRVAYEEVHRMKALVNDLLDLSRIEGGRIRLEFESVPVTILFEHVQTIFKGQSEMKRVSLSLAYCSDLPNVRADANKITWVLSNLISNALRYVGEGGDIELMASRIGNRVHLSVRDNGPGIPQEYQTKIFQKFVQVKGQNPGGSGLGLAICKEIVRAHGGTIWVESQPGEGSTFTFTLTIY